MKPSRWLGFTRRRPMKSKLRKTYDDVWPNVVAVLIGLAIILAFSGVLL